MEDFLYVLPSNGGLSQFVNKIMMRANSLKESVSEVYGELRKRGFLSPGPQKSLEMLFLYKGFQISNDKLTMS